jgi:hypothetical protein
MMPLWLTRKTPLEPHPKIAHTADQAFHASSKELNAHALRRTISIAEILSPNL